MNESHRNISLIVSTMNRPQFLERLLSYYSTNKFVGTIIIGDASTGVTQAKNASLISIYSKQVNIVYKTFPGLSLADTVVKLERLVTTHYLAWTGDDDFIVPKSVNKCISFLDKHPEYSAAHGIGLSVKTVGSEPYGPIVKCVKKKQPSSEESCAPARFCDLMEDYSDLHPAVQRTEAFRAINKTFPSTNNLFLCITSSAGPFISGKVKELNTLYLVRQIQDDAEIVGANESYGWITSSNWYGNWEVYKSSIIDCFLLATQINHQQAEDALEMGFRSYMFGNNRIPETPKPFSKLRGREKLIQIGSVLNNRLTRLSFQLMPTISSSLYREPINVDCMQGVTQVILTSLLSPNSRYHIDFMGVHNSISNPPGDLRLDDL